MSVLDAGEPVTQEALDKRCEIWLDRVFGLKLDFAIENSLPVCLEDGVITRDNQVDLLLWFACLCAFIPIVTCDKTTSSALNSLPICLEMCLQNPDHCVWSESVSFWLTVTSCVFDV